MKAPSILVVGETPSLGRSVTDLLDAESLPVELVHDIGSKAPLANLAARYPVVVVACNSYFCDTARRWARGELPKVALVVVGSRDPLVLAEPQIRSVRLPIAMPFFLDLIRSLLAAPPPSDALAAQSPPPSPSHRRRHGLVSI